jgi:hypothetical protein
LPGDTLEAVLNSNKLVIVHFLRHLNCIYCRHQVDEMRAFWQQHPRFPPIVFVHQSSVSDGEAFFARHFPEAMHISNPDRSLYRMFQIHRLKLISLFNPLTVLKGLWITLRGYIARPVAPGDDYLLLSGTFMFRDGKLVWAHRPRIAGDDPRWGTLFGSMAPAAAAPQTAVAQPAPKTVG